MPPRRSSARRSGLLTGSGNEAEFAVRDISTPLDIERLAGLDEAEVGELEFRLEAEGSFDGR